jgi:hypothetical protein
MKWSVLSLVALGLVGSVAAFWIMRSAPTIAPVPIYTEAPKPAEPPPIVPPALEQRTPVAPVTWSQIQSRSADTAQKEVQREPEQRIAIAWEDKSGVVTDIALGGLIVRPVTGTVRTPDTRDPDDPSRIGAYSHLQSAYNSYGQAFLVLGYQSRVDQGKSIHCKAAKVGSRIYNGKPIEVWDCNP